MIINIHPIIFIHRQENNLSNYNWLNKTNFKYFVSGVVGLGSGLALMPIFNKELFSLKEFGIDVHANKTIFAISTINTMFIITPTTTISFYKFINENKKYEETSKQKILFKLGVLLTIFPAMFQVSQLWNVELHDQKISESSGFDEYIAWATCTTTPLLANIIVKNIKSLKTFMFEPKQNYELDSLGSKIFVYSTTCLSIIGRSIAYTHAIKEFFTNLGLDENFSLSLGIIFGGLIGSSFNGAIEYNVTKKLFSENHNNLSAKELTLGILCVLQGGWFSLPTISDGLDAVKDWQSFIQAAIFLPTFLTKTIHESNSLYESLQLKKQNEVILVEPNIENNFIQEDTINLVGNNIFLEDI